MDGVSPTTTTTTCSYPGCDLPHRARDLCAKHYRRLMAYGDPAGSSPRGGPVLTPSALERAGLSSRQWNYWCLRGWLQVPVAENGRRAWSRREVRIALLMHRLTAAGFTAATAAEIAREVVVSSRGAVALGQGLVLRVVEPPADRDVDLF